jgi:hypothetical protein
LSTAAISVNFCRRSTVSCRSMQPLPYLPRIFGRQNNRNNVPARTSEECYRRAVFLPFVDGILTQMSLRFCNCEAAVLRLCGLLSKFAPNVSFRDIEEGVDHYATLLYLYTMFRRGSTSSLNFNSDVIKTGSTETETDCTEAETETKTDMSETKTAKKRSRQVSRPTSLNFRCGRYFAIQWTIRHVIV